MADELPTTTRKPHEQAAIDRCKAARAACPDVKFTKTGETSMQIDIGGGDKGAAWSMLTLALGSTDVDFTEGLTLEIAHAALNAGKPDPDRAGYMLAMVKGVGARDQIEAMLAAQMAAAHMATMSAAGWRARCTTADALDAADRVFHRAARTFVTQVEALKRHRSNGEQRVVVERVNVGEGGQAIVGEVTTKRGGA